MKYYVGEDKRYSYEPAYKEARYLAICDLVRGVSETVVLQRYRLRKLALAAWKRADIINQDWINDYEWAQWENNFNYARRYYLKWWLAHDRSTAGTAKHFKVSTGSIRKWLREDKQTLWGDTAEGQDRLAWDRGKVLMKEAKRIIRQGLNGQTHNANLPESKGEREWLRNKSWLTQ